MSNEKSNSPGSPESASAAVAGKRHAAKSRSGKPAKSPRTNRPAMEESVAEKSPPSYPVFDLAEPVTPNETPKSSDSGDTPQQEGSKRKRRRKKGKGGGSQNATQASKTEASPEAEEESSGGAAAPPPQPARQTRPKLDSEGVAKLAWKIFLAEVSEEGVALIGDSDAKELSRRCFRLAEIFMEEQARRG
jgi:hypothetical protein